MYRAVHYYTYDISREKLRDIGILRVLGITEELEKCFELMEHRLQLYILGGITPVVNMYNDIAGASFELKNIVENERKIFAERLIQVYFDNGEGFAEKTSLRFSPAEYNNETRYVKYTIPVNNAVSVRIDPADTCCVLHDLKILSEGVEISAPKIQTNGTVFANNSYVATGAINSNSG